MSKWPVRPLRGSSGFRQGLSRSTASSRVGRRRISSSSGHGVGIFSIEMSKQQLGLRLLSAESGVDSHALRTASFNQSDWFPLAQAAGRLEGLPLWIDDSGDLTSTMLRAKARRLKAKHNIDVVLSLQS